MSGLAILLIATPLLFPVSGCGRFPDTPSLVGIGKDEVAEEAGDGRW